MLPRPARLTEADGFRAAVRSGRRAGSATLVVHWHDQGPEPAQVGFVVSKAVGNAVVRNRVKRRLRHLTREHLRELPGRGVLVVRALPDAATARPARLDADLAHGLRRVLTPRSAS
ncbi:ribonuclease P protein component [Nocardioides campestrisoli]|uniref:ribonuclease P protein component n=1 Tax=Nocardioides campestrisoli TaxID=2736757 RepID=UPI0015E77F22|nr:ribonuclease P protein component [Nocardioides campestrisoli]